MATKKSTLPKSEEPKSPAEDTQNIPTTVTEDVKEDTTLASEEDVQTDTPPQEQVDFADEDAALAADNAGLDMGEAAPEEEADAINDTPGNDLADKSKEELLVIFSKMLEERPVQSLRRDVEALKIAFYKLRRAEVEAARRAFIEGAGRKMPLHRKSILRSNSSKSCLKIIAVVVMSSSPTWMRVRRLT